MRRALVCVLFLGCVCGCASYRDVPLPVCESADVPALEGKEVRTRLTSGEEVRGRVVSVDSAGFVVHGPSNFGWTEAEVAWEDVAELSEAETGPGFFSGLVVGALATAALVGLAVSGVSSGS